jgi:hypothetical protein
MSQGVKVSIRLSSDAVEVLKKLFEEQRGFTLDEINILEASLTAMPRLIIRIQGEEYHYMNPGAAGG